MTCEFVPFHAPGTPLVIFKRTLRSSDQAPLPTFVYRCLRNSTRLLNTWTLLHDPIVISAVAENLKIPR